MNLIQWKPLNTMFPWRNRVNRFFDEDFLSDWFDMEKAECTWCPSTDIYENKDNYIFKVELPGIKKEDITIEVKDGLLTIKGERKQEKEVKNDDYHKIESYSGSFSRSFHIPKDIDEKKIKAELKDGILELRVPKSEEKKVKQIPISVN